MTKSGALKGAEIIKENFFSQKIEEKTSNLSSNTWNFLMYYIAHSKRFVNLAPFLESSYLFIYTVHKGKNDFNDIKTRGMSICGNNHPCTTLVSNVMILSPFLMRTYFALVNYYRFYGTFCVCSSFYCVCRSYSSRAYRWHTNHIYGISSQVGQSGAICRIVYAHTVNIILWSNRMKGDFVTNRFSLKSFLRQVTPIYYKACGAGVMCSYHLGSSRWSWL